MDDYQSKICPDCSVALLYPLENPKLINEGWFRCEFCGYCKIIESETSYNRTKNQK